MILRTFFDDSIFTRNDIVSIDIFGDHELILGNIFKDFDFSIGRTRDFNEGRKNWPLGQTIENVQWVFEQINIRNGFNTQTNWVDGRFQPYIPERNGEHLLGHSIMNPRWWYEYTKNVYKCCGFEVDTYTDEYIKALVYRLFPKQDNNYGKLQTKDYREWLTSLGLTGIIPDFGTSLVYSSASGMLDSITYNCLLFPYLPSNTQAQPFGLPAPPLISFEQAPYLKYITSIPYDFTNIIPIPDLGPRSATLAASPQLGNDILFIDVFAISDVDYYVPTFDNIDHRFLSLDDPRFFANMVELLHNSVLNLPSLDYIAYTPQRSLRNLYGYSEDDTIIINASVTGNWELKFGTYEIEGSGFNLDLHTTVHIFTNGENRFSLSTAILDDKTPQKVFAIVPIDWDGIQSWSFSYNDVHTFPSTINKSYRYPFLRKEIKMYSDYLFFENVSN